MPICRQGGGAGDGGRGAAGAIVTVLPVVEVPRHTRVRGNDSALHFKSVIKRLIKLLYCQNE